MTLATHARPIVIAPVGRIERRLVAWVAEDARAALRRDVVVADRVPLPSHAFSRQRDQWLDALADIKRADWLRLLGIADVDLYAPDLNFVFGEADERRGVAVFSTARRRGKHGPAPSTRRHRGDPRARPHLRAQALLPTELRDVVLQHAGGDGQKGREPLRGTRARVGARARRRLVSVATRRDVLGELARSNAFRLGALLQLHEDVPTRASTSFSFRATIVFLRVEGMRATHRRASALRKPRGNSSSGSAANSRPRVGER